MTQRYYPQGHGPRLDEDLRLLYDDMYRGHDKAKADAKPPSVPAVKAGGPSNTTLTGIGVKGTPPVHGASPFYNQSTGQFEFNTAAGAVTPPIHPTSPGQPGQVAYDSGFVYVCVGVNSWLRAALSTFP